MPQIFHPSMNTLSRVSIFGAIFFIAAAVGVAALIVRSPYATDATVIKPQPVPFSHQHHVAEAGIDCRYCHRTAETEAFADIPSTSLCMDCHSQLFTDSEILEPVRESFRTGQPLHWNRVHDMPDYVYFHHGIHVSKGISCQECHGRVDKMPLMWQSRPLMMENCLECHRDPKQAVRPADAVLIMGWARDEQTPSPEELAEVHSLDSKIDCSYCHR